MNGGISGRATNKLDQKKVQSFIARAKAGKAETAKKSDGGGLYLTLTPAGTPVWRIKYRIGGEERLFSVGTYPAITLEQARAKREEVKATVREGKDPVQSRRLAKAEEVTSSGQTFKGVAEDWLKTKKKGWSAIHHEKSSQAFERDVYPRMGDLPVRDISAAIVASVIESIVNRGTRDTATKVLQHVRAVFRLAQARGMRTDNPAEPVREVIPAKRKKGRRAALLKLPDLGDILRRAEGVHLSPAVRMAHRLCAFTAARISNVVEAEWKEFDLEADVSIWTIPRDKMKSQDREHDHKVILCPAIAAELRQWQATTGGKGYVFPSPAGGKHITREAIEKAYRVTLNLSKKHSPHGWRSALSTLARDNGHERDVVELALDHIHDNEVVRAYDRGERLQQRIKLMNWWGDSLTQAQQGAEVFQIYKRA